MAEKTGRTREQFHPENPDWIDGELGKAFRKNDDHPKTSRRKNLSAQELSMRALKIHLVVAAYLPVTSKRTSTSGVTPKAASTALASCSAPFCWSLSLLTRDFACRTRLFTSEKPRRLFR